MYCQGDNLLDLENGIDALGGDQGEAGFIGEDERRIEAVVDSDVDLTAAAAVGIDNKGTGGAVALGKVGVEEFEPVGFAGGAASAGVFEGAADLEVRQHAALQVQQQRFQFFLRRGSFLQLIRNARRRPARTNPGTVGTCLPAT